MILHSLIRGLTLITLGSALGGAPDANAAISLQNGYYLENFNTTLNPTDWVFSGQENSPTTPTLGLKSYIDGGRATVTSGAGQGQVSGTGPASVTYPLPAIVTPGSYGQYGFSGSWLTNLGAMKNSEGVDYANGNTSLARSASVNFNQLQSHSSIHSISFLLGVGDSIDSNEGVFEVKLDGMVIYRQDFNNTIGGEINPNPPSGFPNVTNFATVETYAVGANLKSDGFYRETWTGTNSVNDRKAEGWTLDAAYKITLNNLAHSADTMNLTFSWYGLNGDYADEYIAMDNLMIVVPEPSQTALAALGLGAWFIRRRRKVTIA